jgi:hypothetical protein
LQNCNPAKSELVENHAAEYGIASSEVKFPHQENISINPTHASGDKSRHRFEPLSLSDRSDIAGFPFASKMRSREEPMPHTCQVTSFLGPKEHRSGELLALSTINTNTSIEITDLRTSVIEFGSDDISNPL